MADQSSSTAQPSGQGTSVAAWLAENAVPTPVVRSSNLLGATKNLIAAATQLTTGAKYSVPRAQELIASAQDKLRGSLEKLPVKIRYRIYRLALGGDAENTRYALAPPALGAVSRQIRGEVLPIYYAESTFSVALPLEDWAWERFTRWCESGPVREHLARIPAAIFFHRMKIGDDAGNVWEVTVGFDMIGRTQRELADHRLHICQRDEAWGSLVEDFYLSFDQDDTIPQRILDEFPLGRLVDVLCALAPLCTRANQQIMLVKDCDEWEN